MCGGGGGGPDPVQMRREEDLRALKSAQSVAAINSIFGVDDPSTYQVDNRLLDERAWINEMLAPKSYTEMPKEEFYEHDRWRPRGDRQPITRQGYAFEEAMGIREDDDDGVRRHGPTHTLQNRDFDLYLRDYGTERLASSLRKRLDEIPDYKADPYVADAAKNKAGIHGLYDSTRQDIIDYFKSDLDTQKRQAEKGLRASLARSGHLGGQVEVRAGEELLGAYNDGLLDATNRADSTISGLRASDDSARLGLINQIYAGMDTESALSSANAQLKSNADSARSSAMTQSLGNIFGDLGEKYKLSQYVAGANQAGAPPPVRRAGAYVSPNESNGTIVR